MKRSNVRTTGVLKEPGRLNPHDQRGPCCFGSATSGKTTDGSAGHASLPAIRTRGVDARDRPFRRQRNAISFADLCARLGAPVKSPRYRRSDARLKTTVLYSPSGQITLEARAKGKCEYSRRAELAKLEGSGHVETHHIFRLADQGLASPQNVIVQSSCQHREANFGA